MVRWRETVHGEECAMTKKIQYQGALVCSINVSNLDRSIAFFRDAMGFEEVYRMADYGWCEMRTPVEGVTIGLQQAESGFGGDGGATLAFRVSDVEGARKHLEANGARFDGDIVEIPGDTGVKLANFFDPDGNPFTLAEPNRVAAAS
jgi:catechol 2,3-dioxygenase-like lactoylglutathione lyase family enzyme